MKHTHTRTHARLGAAVAAVLAVAAVGGAVTVPAYAAAPVAVRAAADAEQAAPLDIPLDSVLLTAGRTGFLSRTGTDAHPVHRWTPYDGGRESVIFAAGERWGSPGTDLVVSRAGAHYTFTDMTGATPTVSVDLSGTATPYTLLRVVGSTLVMETTTAGGREELHLVSVEGGEVVDRPVALPEADGALLTYPAGADGLAVLHRATVDGVPRLRVGVVDLATGALPEAYDLGEGTDRERITVSATRVAWIEGADSAAPRLTVVTRRSSAPPVRLPVEYGSGARGVLLHLTGAEWVTSVKPGGGTATGGDPADHALTARRLTDGNQAYPLLDHVASAGRDRNGDLLVLGGDVDQGEGLYRVETDQVTGLPAASLVRGFGVPTALTLVGETAPAAGTLDFDRADTVLAGRWTFSRTNASAQVKVRHTATGRTVTLNARQDGAAFSVAWKGRWENGIAAFNGAYTWTMTARPANGIGPDVVRTGSFAVTRAPRPHDFDDNGAADLLVREADGRLALRDARQLMTIASPHVPYRYEIGRGWDAYDRIVTPGNIGGTSHADLVARDRAGVLWYYAGKAKNFAPRVRIGGGWNTYATLAGGSDVTGDGRPDLLATDRAGVLWLYPAKGDGTFAARTRIGGGWGGFTELVGAGDVDGDGRADLLAASEGPVGPDGLPETLLSLYRGTGLWKTPFAAPVKNPGGALGNLGEDLY
ncbi:FG-GAP repeat domain-containing protein [Streptomyces sp. NPDC058955]|uniref:FG-GAP repeat domain-containing protein n=1 Tax=Streptomyces sp. NPDC058955 TaxID=3346678 RepID=UPI00367E8206